MARSHYQSRPENSKLKIRRPLNRDRRSREYLEQHEVTAVLQVADQRGRHPERDKALMLLMYRHGLRVQEAAKLRWDAVTFNPPRLSINRLKGSEAGNHPMQTDEVEVLRKVRQRYPNAYFVFPNERGGALSTGAIARIVKECGELVELPMTIHPHMLRHSCGYYLANQGLDTRLIQDWLGHRNIQHTVRYTKLNPKRFEAIQW